MVSKAVLENFQENAVRLRRKNNKSLYKDKKYGMEILLEVIQFSKNTMVMYLAYKYGLMKLSFVILWAAGQVGKTS